MNVPNERMLQAAQLFCAAIVAVNADHPSATDDAELMLQQVEDIGISPPEALRILLITAANVLKGLGQGYDIDIDDHMRFLIPYIEKDRRR